MAYGRKNGLTIEVYGSEGSISFDLERLNELVVDTGNGGARTLVTEADHPYAGAWWPPGHVLGWDHTFTSQAADFLTADGRRHPALPQLRRRPRGPARARRDLGQRRAGRHPRATSRHTDAYDEDRRPDGQALHALHRPVGRPDARGGRVVRRGLGVRRPRDRRLRRAPRRVAVGRRRLHRGAARHPGPARTGRVGDLQPPQGPGRLRRPDRRPAPVHRRPAGLGRR